MTKASAWCTDNRVLKGANDRETGTNVHGYLGGKMLKRLIATTVMVVLAGCAQTKGVVNPAGMTVQDVEIGSRGPVAGVGIGGNDIEAIADQMVRSMLANPILAGAATPPRVKIDAEDFRNESTQPINKNSIVGALRIELARAANGRIRFSGQENAAATEKQRALKRQGVTDVGTRGLTKAQLGVDYFLVGTITSLDARSAKTGLTQRFTQITFEMQDAETNELVWGDRYRFERVSGDDVIYR